MPAGGPSPAAPLAPIPAPGPLPTAVEEAISDVGDGGHAGQAATQVAASGSGVDGRGVDLEPLSAPTSAVWQIASDGNARTSGPATASAWQAAGASGAAAEAGSFEGLRMQTLRLLITDEEMLRSFQRLEDELAQHGQRREMTLASGVGLGATLSIGYVVWLVRGGVLLSSVLSALPAWQLLDPLPVLTRRGAGRGGAGAAHGEDDGDGEDGDAVERLFGAEAQTPAATPPPTAQTPADPRTAETGATT